MISCVAADRRTASGALAGDALHIAAVAQGCKRIGGKTARLSPRCRKWPNVAPESAAEQLLRCNQVARLLMRGELFAIHQRSLQPDLLCGYDGLHRCLDLALQVVALVNHEGDVKPQAVSRCGVNLVEDRSGERRVGKECRS